MQILKENAEMQNFSFPYHSHQKNGFNWFVNLSFYTKNKYTSMNNV